jgi:multidrug efflux system membrane fusion protein
MLRVSKQMPSMRNGLMAAVLVLAVAACGGKPDGANGKAADKDKAGDAPVPVTVVAAQQRDVEVQATALGTVAAQNTVTVSPQVGGQLMSLNFREGEPVSKGQVLARIDARSAQASYDEAAAAKRQNQALLATARANYARSSAPEYSQYVSRTDLDTQRNQVAQYESAVAAADAGMRAAQVQLQYTAVVAPISGIAGLRHVDAGNIVAAGTALVTLTQTQPIQVVFNLPESQLTAVRQASSNGEVPVVASERGASKALAQDGKVDVIDNQISTDSGTFRVRALFPNANESLWPGQFVNVRLRLGKLADAVVIPAQAVQRGPDGDFVYVLDGEVVRQQAVSVGVEVDDQHVQVNEGIKAGDRVVTEGQFRLKPGSKVIALAPGQTPPPPPAEKSDKDKEDDGPQVTVD